MPDSRYGYGIVNPYLAVTAVRDDSLIAPTTKPGAPLPAPVRAAPTDRHLQHLALTTAIVLLALAALAAAGAAVLRATRAKHDPAPTSNAAGLGHRRPGLLGSVDRERCGR